MTADSDAGITAVPTSEQELAELEASYVPFHSAAAWRRVHIDEPRWTRYAHTLAGRIQTASEETWLEIKDLVFRAASFESGALDGLFAPNPELTATVLASSVQGAEQDDVATAVGLLAECHRRAFILAAEFAADGRAVTANLIAVLQDVITESQASYMVSTNEGRTVEVDLPRRQYKPVSNYLALPHGRLAVFAPASRVADEMERLTSELASVEFASLHPAVQAAYAHYALTAIHPFADGNGRLARVVASIYMMRAVGVPLLIFADQWPAYYQALGFHDLGVAHRPSDRQQLADYISVAAISAMDIASNLLGKRACGRLEGPVSRKGSNRDECLTAVLDSAGRSLIDALYTELRELLTSPPPRIRLAMAETRAMPPGHVESAYRMVRDPETGRCGVRVAVHADRRGAQATAELEFVALASELPHDMLPVAIRETHTNELLEVALGDAHPLVLEPTALRIRLWLERLIAETITPILAAPARSTAPSTRRRSGERPGDSVLSRMSAG